MAEAHFSHSFIDMDGSAFAWLAGMNEYNSKHYLFIELIPLCAIEIKHLQQIFRKTIEIERHSIEFIQRACLLHYGLWIVAMAAAAAA